MPLKDFTGKTVLITGAGSGIGRETALAFAARGASLELLDLSPEGLEQTARMCSPAGGAARLHTVDVSDPEAMDRVGDDVHSRVTGVDVLVNNAGIGAAGRFLDTTLETWRRTMDVNLMGVVHGCRTFAPRMVERGEPSHIVNVASVAGLVALADMPVYAASKFAVVGFSESLRADLRAHGIGVSCICPGVIDTPIVKKTRYEGAELGPEEQAKIHRFYEKRSYPPSKVAAAIVRAVERNAGVVPVSPESWVLWSLERVAPGLASRLGAAGSPFGSKR